MLFLSVPFRVTVTVLKSSQERVPLPQGAGPPSLGIALGTWNKRDGVKVGLVLVFPCPSITP